MLVAAILGTLGLTGRAAAQGTLPPPNPVPIAPPPDPTPIPFAAPGPVISRPIPQAAVPPAPAPVAPPPFAPPPPGPSPQVYGNPYGVSTNEPLIFFNWELQLTAPTMSNHMSNSVTLPDGSTKNIAIPGASLDFTIAPKLEVGYRLPDQLGAFIFGYRFLATDGKEAETVDGIAANVRSRLDFNEFDFDYATARYDPEPRWFVQARIGARVSWTYYDTSTSPDALGAVDRESSYFVGAGPHIALDLERKLIMGFGAFASVDGAILIGQVDQHFAEDVAGSYDVITSPMRKTLAVPTLQAQIGLSYSPPSFERLRFRVGYQYEQWFNLGSVEGSRLDLTTQGGFLRGEIDF